MSAPAYVTRAEADPRRRAALLGAEHLYEASKGPGSTYPAWANTEPTFQEESARQMMVTLKRLEDAGLVKIVGAA